MTTPPPVLPDEPPRDEKPSPQLQELFWRALAHLETGLKTPLSETAELLFNAAYKEFLRHRNHTDNRIEHELVVFGNFLRIGLKLDEQAWGRPLKLPDLKIGATFSFFHDSFPIDRTKITESHLKGIAAENQSEAKLKKIDERRRHLIGGAKNAKNILEGLHGQRGALNYNEIASVVPRILSHDLWKIGIPIPLTYDPLGVALHDADALWPISFPYGPFADLRRYDPQVRPTWRQLQDKVRDNYNDQLKHYRTTFETLEDMPPGETVIRTAEGLRIQQEYLEAWEIVPTNTL